MWSSCTCIVVPLSPCSPIRDQEIDPDRWCSHSAWGKECWQQIVQWVPEPPPGAGASGGTNAAAHHRVCPCHSGASRTSGCLTCAYIWLCSPRSRHPPRKTGRFTGADFPLQPDGTLRCPAGQLLSAQEQRRARRWEPAHCVCGQHSPLPPLSVARAVPMEWRGNSKAGARVSVLLHPLLVGDQPLRLRGTGAAENIGAPACNSCAINASRCVCPPSPLSPTLFSTRAR